MLALAFAAAILVGSQVPGRADDSASTGILAAASGLVEVRSLHQPSAPPRRLRIGKRVRAGDEVITGQDVRAQIMLRDGTTFAIGEQARLVIDEFTYDPATGAGALGAVIRQGAFRFVSGRIAKTSPGNVKLIAGNTAIEINGTEVLGTINGISDEVILMSGEVALTSIGGECGGGAPQGDIFSIDAGGFLQSSLLGAGAISASCNRALVRPGFGVQVVTSGRMTSPGRVAAKAVDTVIDAVTVKAVAAPDGPLPTGTSSERPVQIGAAEPAIVVSGDSRQEDGNTDGSAFDLIVMRNFGMLEGNTSEAAKTDDKGDAGTSLQLATLVGEAVEDGPTEEDKTGTATSSVSDTADDRTIAEEEARYDEKVEEATRDTSSTSGSSSATSGSSSTSSSDADSESSGSGSSGTSTTPNNSPQLASISGFAFSDTSADDSFSSETGALSGSDSDSGDTLTYAISGQLADSSQSGYTHAASGSFGTLYIDSGTGAYIYIPSDSAVEGASSTQTDSFTLSVSDGTATATQTLAVTINGVDDVPTLDPLSGISFTDTAGDDSFSAAAATMSATERDTGDTLTYGVLGGSVDTSRAGFTHSNAGTYGTLYVNTDTGAYEYVPDDSAIEALATQVTETFDLSITDGTSLVRETLVATITGVNDTPEITALSDVTIADTTSYDSFSATTGTISTTERDSGQTLSLGLTGTTAAASDASYTLEQAGDYGVFEFNHTTGAYRYTPTAALVNALADDKTDSFTMTVTDGALTGSRTLTINIDGVDDGPTAIDTSNLAAVSGQQRTGQTGLEIATLSDPEGDVVTDLTSNLNALPAWLSFNNRTVGGAVQYFWEVGASEAPWRNGSKTLSLQARSSGINTSATSVTISFVCQSSHCTDFVRSTDTITSPTVDDATNISQITGSVKIGGTNYTLMSEAQRDALFDTTTNATGSFRLVYSAAETGSGSPSGTWDFDQSLSVDYRNRKIQLTGTVDGRSISYFDGDSGEFSYASELTFDDIQTGTVSVFEGVSSTRSDANFTMKNDDGDAVHFDLTDQIGFLIDSGTGRAAVMNSGINPAASNPTDYNDTTRAMVQPAWRVLEPQ